MQNTELTIAKLNELFPSGEDFRNAFKNGIDMINEDGNMVHLTVSGQSEEKLLYFAVNWAKNMVVKKATLLLY